MRQTETAVPDAADTPLTLPRDLGIEQAAALNQLLAAHVSRREPVVLEGAGVWSLHAATLQLLAAFVGTRRRAGCATEWREPSEILRNGATRLGLATLLGLPGAN